MHPNDRWLLENIVPLLLCILTKVVLTKDSPLYDAFSPDEAQDMGESCLLYPVHSKNPSPSYLLHEGAPVAMTINHLQDSIVATLLLQTTSETCQLLVTKKDITVEGDCLYDQEAFSSLSLVEEQEFLTVLVEQAHGSIRVYLPAAPTRSIRLRLQDLTEGVHAQVSGVGPLNAAFDCFSGCLEIGNSTWVHSNGTLRLFTDPNISGQLKGTMSILYGIDDREWRRQKQLDLSFDEFLIDFGDSKALVIQPTFGDRIWGGYYLSINKTLTKHRSGNIGAVPSKDLYVQFNNMNNFRWSLGCLLLNNVLIEEEELATDMISSKSKTSLEEVEGGILSSNISSGSRENPEVSSNEKQSINGKSSETSIFFGQEIEDEENISSENREKSEEINHGGWKKWESEENSSEEIKYIKDNLLKSIENIDKDQLKYSSQKSKIKKKSKVVYDDYSTEISNNRIDNHKPYSKGNNTDGNTNKTGINITMTLKPILMKDGELNLKKNSTTVMLNTTNDHESEHVATLSTGILYKIVISVVIILLLGSLILICIVHGCKKKDGLSKKYHVSAQSSLKPTPSCHILHSAAPDPPTYTVDNPVFSPDN